MIDFPSNFVTANAALVKKPIYLFTIEGYARVFTNYATGVGGQYPWITDIEDLSITVSDLDGGADLNTLSIAVQDRDGLITADWPTALFEGKSCTLKTGFKGMSQADFGTLFTGVVTTVDTTDGNMAYVFNCDSPMQVLQKVIYATGDDGHPTDSNHPKTLNGHPLDILVSVLEDQIGLTTDRINLARIQDYRDSIYAGAQFTFTIDSPPAAKDFIEQQLLQVLGGYLWVNNLGQFDVSFFYRRAIVPGRWVGTLMGSFADVTGQLVDAPFMIGLGAVVKVPAGATQLLMGVNESYWGANVGTVYVTINGGAPVGIDAETGPWQFSGGINAEYPYSYFTHWPIIGDQYSLSPVSVGATPGTTLTIVYDHGQYAFDSLLSPFVDSGGWVGKASNYGTQPYPAAYAYTPGLETLPTAATIDRTNTFNDAEPLSSTADLCNVVSFRFDKTTGGSSGGDSSGFAAQEILTYDKSIARFGTVGDGQLYGQHIIESDGARSGFQGYYLGSFVARLIFQRYGLKNLTYEADLLWSKCNLEPGDLVRATYPLMPDRQAGVVGVTDRMMEVMDRTWNFREGKVTVKLLDAAYLLSVGTSLIAPTGMADYASASADDKATYMFICDNTDKYSNSDSGKTLA